MKGRGLVGFFFMALHLCVYVHARVCEATYLQVEKFCLLPSIVWSNICILIFFLKSNINVDLIRKINDFENNMLKAECVENTFEI